MRFGIAATAALLALVPAPVGAQESSPVAITPAPAPEGAVGPSQLRDFNLNGTVIRRAEPAERSEPAPERQQPSTAAAAPPAASAPTRNEPARQRAERRPQPSGEAAPSTGSAQPEQPSAAASAPLDLPPATPAGPLFSPVPVLPDSTDSSGPAQALPQDSGFSPLPWLFALLLLGGAAAYYFRRQRSSPAFAGGPDVSEFAQPEQAPKPQPQVQPRPQSQPAPAPAPAPPAAPVGIVSTRLRPTLDVQFSPERVLVEADRVILEFAAQVTNSGSGPARDILLEAAMFNAGPSQEQDLNAFFARPAAQGDRVAMIEPLKSLGFRSAVSLPREQLRQFQAGERVVFVPLVGFNLLYRSAGADAQTSVSFLVGIDRNGDRLAPFRLDQGPRAFTGLAARALDTGLRK